MQIQNHVYKHPSRRTIPGTDYRVEANAGLNRVRRATWERVHVLRVGSLWDTKYCTFAPLLPRLANIRFGPRNSGLHKPRRTKTICRFFQTFPRPNGSSTLPPTTDQLLKFSTKPFLRYSRFRKHFYIGNLRVAGKPGGGNLKNAASQDLTRSDHFSDYFPTKLHIPTALLTTFASVSPLSCIYRQHF